MLTAEDLVVKNVQIMFASHVKAMVVDRESSQVRIGVKHSCEAVSGTASLEVDQVAATVAVEAKPRRSSQQRGLSILEKLHKRCEAMVDSRRKHKG